MRSVIAFWQTEQDEQELFSYLIHSDCLIGSIGDFLSPAEFAPRRLCESLPLHKAADYVIFPTSVADQIILSRGGEQRNWKYFIDWGNSPVIVYCSKFLNSETLEPTNVVANWDRVVEIDGRKVLQKKDEGFIKWGKGVFHGLRAHNNIRIPEKDLPMTENAKKAFDRGINLVK